MSYGKRYEKTPLKIMDNEIEKFDVYVLSKTGQLIKTYKIQSTRDYNHLMANLHHYIPFNQYYRNKMWFEERGIKQKLILLPIALHEQVHNIAVHNLSDDDFKRKYGVTRDKLIFRRGRVYEEID